MNEDIPEDDQIQPPARWKRIVRGVIAAIAIIGLLYLTGVYQHFFLRRTPAGIEQTPLSSKVEAEEIRVPVVVHILSGPTGSARTQEDADRLIRNANNIWTQAKISFYVEDVQHRSLTDDDLRLFELNPHTFIQRSDTYNPRVVNVYLSRTLAGVNGLAYGGTHAVSVADYTSTLDFRTLAHEFGHTLGLDHVSDRAQLMSSGATGTELTIEEIETARSNANF